MSTERITLINRSDASSAEIRQVTGKIRVVHLIHTIEYGGIETILLNWLRGLDNSRFENHLVCFANPGQTEKPFVDAARRHGIRVDLIPWHRGKPVYRAMRKLLELQAKYQADVVHTHNTYAHLVGLLASYFSEFALVGSVYVWGDFGLRRNLLQRVDAWILRRFDAVTAQCQKTLARTHQQGIPKWKSTVLESGLPVEEVPLRAERRVELRHRYHTGAQDFVLLNVARLNTEKAQDLLLDSFREIANQHAQARLWIAGVGPLESELRQRSERLGIAERVSWLGFVVELPELFALADVVVHPSREEGVPLALCQAMAAGKPIVATSVGGVPEIIKDRSSGLLIPSGDIPALVAAIEEIITNPDFARRLGKQAQRFIAEEYQLTNSIDKLAELYVQLVAHSGAGGNEPVIRF